MRFRVSEVPLYGETYLVLGLQVAASCDDLVFFIDNLLVRIYSIIVMIEWTGLAPWEFEFPFPGGLTSTLLWAVD